MAKKAPTLDPEVELEEDLDEELDEVVDQLQDLDDLTVAVVKSEKKYKGPTVEVFLPELPHSDGVKVDQYEHVTIANERGETCYKIHRGERVEVPVPVFLILKDRYPKL